MNTLFNKVDYDLNMLMSSIEMGDIALPDIQRPFVWSNAKVRNLFDSLYRGYPVGYFLFWQNADAKHVRSIGDTPKQRNARLLVVDGQQRLTSLFAVLRGVPVIREDFTPVRIQIAFNPLTESFAVADAAIRNNKQFLPDISVLWHPDTSLFSLVPEYLTGLSDVMEVDDQQRKAVENAIQRLAQLGTFSMTAIELSNQMDVEDVAEVFVRINSEGKQLNQADFILTLMSVFQEEGRRSLESFARAARVPSTSEPSPYNHFLAPDPDQLLRVAVALAFRRARLKYVYSVLRGKDLETGEFSVELRDRQFERLSNAQGHVLNVQYWLDFLNVLRAAGFRNGKMISSKTAFVYTYALYLIGKIDFGVDEHELRKVMAQWFFMSTITGRYTSSPESKMEFDLARLRNLNTAEEFCSTLRQVCSEVLTGDYWTITLPGELATSSARSPTQLAYFASLVLLDANVLFSEQRVSDLLDGSIKGKRSAIERHHLFPKAHLKENGRTGSRVTNQIANYALLEWGDNSRASKKAPSVYLPDFLTRFSGPELERMYFWHALADGWENMEYESFLAVRRERMAAVVKKAYETLRSDNVSQPSTLDMAEIVELGESDSVEFKSTLRVNLHTGKKDPRMEHACLKTIVGFLNAKGGRLVIGVSDDGEARGLDTDGFKNEDRMNLHLVNLLNTRVGKQFMMYITPRFEEYKDDRVFVVECMPARSPVYLIDGATESFFVRAGASTSELVGRSMQAYIGEHFD